MQLHIVRTQILLWTCEWRAYAGSSSEVKIETDSNDVMEIKTEADVTGSPHGDTPSTSTYSVCDIYYSFFQEHVFCASLATGELSTVKNLNIIHTVV